MMKTMECHHTPKHSQGHSCVIDTIQSHHKSQESTVVSLDTAPQTPTHPTIEPKPVTRNILLMDFMRRAKRLLQRLVIFCSIAGMASTVNAHAIEPTEILGSLANLSIYRNSVQLELVIGIEAFELITGLYLPREYTDEYRQNWDFHHYHHDDHSHHSHHGEHNHDDHSHGGHSHHKHSHGEHNHSGHSHDNHGHHHSLEGEPYDFAELLGNIEKKSNERRNQIEALLNHHIHISIPEMQLNGKVTGIETCDPKYIKIQLDYPCKDTALIKSLELSYQYEPTGQGADNLCLAVYDKRSQGSPVQVIHLHGHRKTARWSGDSLTSALYPFESTLASNKTILSVFAVLIAVHLLNMFISRRIKSHVGDS